MDSAGFSISADNLVYDGRGCGDQFKVVLTL